MCGVFGIIARPESALYARGAEAALDALFVLSESRGKEAAGIVVRTDDQLIVYKVPESAHAMIAKRAFRDIVRPHLRAESGPRGGLAFIGHSRLVTDGDHNVNFNNQPVTAGGVVGVHNGIVVNHADIWSQNPDLHRAFEVDSEVIFALLDRELGRDQNIAAAAGKVFSTIHGAATIACFIDDRDTLLLATNTGSLYFAADPDDGALVFTSERYILEQLIASGSLGDTALGHRIAHVKPGGGAVIDTRSAAVTQFRFEAPVGHAARGARRTIVDMSPVSKANGRSPRPVDLNAVSHRFPHASTTYRIARCSKCVLPASMPFISFDADGVCSYCKNFQRPEALGLAALEKLVAPYRRSDGQPDCVVGISGGRDSCYGLHVLKNVLGLNPVAYTYDWGMVTDLARRNISRLCGTLGVEHVLVSADIPRKREFIRKNVSAWLARPVLGTIPLFMAGDKAYFHHLNRVKEQVGVDLAFLCENLLERTDFKTGFAGVRPAFHDRNHVYTMAAKHKAALLYYYGKEFLLNPRYLNASILESALAFGYYYVNDRSFHNLYSYVPWDEHEVTTVIDSYGFERSPDTPSTWRIGDGTAAFYNYIYHSVAGFSEHDTLRSNQIRVGALSRDEALALIEVENRPRFASMRWYLDTIGLESDLMSVVDRIQAIPKLYSPIA